MLRITLFVLCFLVVAVQYGNSENRTDCANVTSASGADETRLSGFEKFVRYLEDRFDKVKERIGKIFGRKPSGGTSYGEVLEDFSTEMYLIMPGTRWCGDGDNAKNEADLGIFNKTDACCRAHDNCKNDLLPGEIEVNLKNNGIFTRSACTCDFAFYNCLKNVSSLIAHSIGDTYFNILRPQCYQCECPTPDCSLDDGTECKGQCKEYKWVDNKKF